MNEGVIPSLHIYYKNSHSKQYHKAAKRRAGLRTETTVNNTYDFGVGRRLCNLPALRRADPSALAHMAHKSRKKEFTLFCLDLSPIFLRAAS
jgi:hypothetical protein